MRIVELKYKPFSLMLKTPFINSSNTINERKGFIISVTDEIGNTFLGEASPLPGFSRESIVEVKEELLVLSHALMKMDIEDNIISIKDIADNYILCSSVKFGFEQAMFGLLLKRDRSLLDKLPFKLNSSININSVVGIETDDKILNLIDIKKSQGFSTFKIKVGRNSFDDDLRLIKNIRSKFGDEIIIRLDANGKWDREKAKSNLAKLSEFTLEYIEEPCKGIDNLISLAAISPVPIAVDESLIYIGDANSVFEESNISFIIIKPTVKGGLFEIMELIKQAAVLNKNIIVSSSFETALGKSQLAFLSSLTHHPYSHGLDTMDYFQDYFFKDPFITNNGTISFSSLAYPNEFDYDAIW